MRHLDQLTEAVQKRILSHAFSRAIEPIVSAIEVAIMSMTTRHTGNLESSVGHREKKYSQAVFATIGPLWPLGAHGHLVEFGHDVVLGGSKPSDGRSARKASTAARRGKGRVAGRTRAIPFEEKAWESVQYIALATVEQEISRGILDEVNKLSG